MDDTKLVSTREQNKNPLQTMDEDKDVQLHSSANNLGGLDYVRYNSQNKLNENRG